MVAADAKATAYAQLPKSSASKSRFMILPHCPGRRRAKAISLPSGRLVTLNGNSTSKGRKTRKRLGRLVRFALVALPLLGWAIWLRPEFAGGRVDYVIVGGQSMLPALHGG